MSKVDPFHILRIIPKQYDLPDENIEFHIEQIKEIDQKINKPKPQCYEYERQFRFTSTTKLFSLGYRTRNFNKELRGNKEYYNDCYSGYRDAEISSLHALRLELENEVNKLYELFILECSSIELNIIVHLYNFIREQGLSFPDDKKIDRLIEHTEDILNQLYNREPSDLYRDYSFPVDEYGMREDHPLYKFAEAVFKETNKLDESIIEKASILAIKYALVQETLHANLTDNENPEVLKSLRDTRIKKLLSTKNGKLDYIEEVRDLEDVNSYEEALAIVNEESLRLNNEKAYKDVNSYFVSKSQHHKSVIQSDNLN